MDITEEGGRVIKLHAPFPQFLDKKDSLFVFDKDMGVWFLQQSYNALNPEVDDLSRVPYLTTKQLDNFGIWQIIENH